MDAILKDRLKAMQASDEIISFVERYFVPVDSMDIRMVELIRDAVLLYYAMPVDALFMKNRTRALFVKPRQILHYFCRKFSGASLETIGALCGNKNHATVLHSVEAVEHDMETNKIFALEVANIEQFLREYISTNSPCPKDLQILPSGNGSGLGN